MKEPIITCMKNAEKTTNKIRIPKLAIDMLGKSYYLKVYTDKIVLMPMKRNEEK